MAELRFSFFLAALLLAAFGMTGRLRFLAHECPTVSRRLAAVLLLLAVFSFTIFYPAATAGRANEVTLETIWFPGLFVGHAGICGFLVAWWLVTGCPPWPRFFSFPRRDLTLALRAGVVAGGVGWGLALAGTGAIALVAGLLGHGAAPPPEPPQVMVWMAQLSIARKLLVVAVAMSVEEAFFRAFLQTRFGLWLSSLLFAVAHFSYGLPYLVVGVLTISLIIGVTFRQTGHLLSCIAAHGIFDAIQLFIVLPAVVRVAT